MCALTWIEEDRLAEANEEGKALYERCRDDLLKRQLSNSENFDKSILSLSTAGLGFSLAFIKEVVRLPDADYWYILYGSWCCFALAIVGTLCSFLASQKGIDRQLDYAKEYYLENKHETLDKKNWWAKVTNWLNYLSVGVFIVAIFSTIAFVWLNPVGGRNMSAKKTIREAHIQEGAPVPGMQPFKKGQPIPAMQPLNSPQDSAQEMGGAGQEKTEGSGRTDTAVKKK